MIDDNGKKRKIIFIIILIIVICLFITLIVYVENRSYINNIDFRLNGSQVTEIEVGIEWKDPSVISMIQC